MVLNVQRCHHEAGVGSLVQVFGLGHDPPLAAPSVHGLIPQVGEDAGRLLGRLVLLPSLFRLRCDHPEQPRVLGQTEE